MKRFSSVSIYLILSLTGIVLFLIVAPFVGQRIMDWVAMENNSDWAALDYYRCIPDSQHLSETYFQRGSVVYPPLAYLYFYYVFRVTTVGPILNDMWAVPNLPYQLFLFIMYTSFAVFWFAHLMERFPCSRKEKTLLGLSLLLSVPMSTGALERGNTAIYVLLLLLQAVQWKDAEEAWKRECALIFIALAAGLKIYPAVFGLFYVKEKRWPECLRLILYGACAFFLPFLMYGGLRGFLQYLKILAALSAQKFELRCQFFKGALALLGIQGQLANALNAVFALSLLAGIYFSKSKFRAMAFFAAFMALVPPNAYRYTLIYLILPLYFLFGEDTAVSQRERYLYAALMGCIFTIPTIFGVVTRFTLSSEDTYTTFTFVEWRIYLAAWLWLGVLAFYEIYRQMRTRQILLFKRGATE